MSIKVSELLNLIPENLLDELGAKTKVDKKNTYRLTGKAVFEILFYSLLEEDRTSLRVIEDILKRQNFKFYHKGTEIKGSRSGLSDRLKVINYEYFEGIFKELGKSLSKYIPEDSNSKLMLFDTTVVTLSSKLLHIGHHGGTKNTNQIKFSVGYNGLPLSCNIRADKSAVSEDVALRDAIMAAGLDKDSIAVFDRGLCSRKTFSNFSETGIMFVTRLKDRTAYKIKKITEGFVPFEADNLRYEEDCIIQLRSTEVRWVPTEFRLIKAYNKTTDKHLLFLSNMFELPAEQVTAIYKSRWDIEVFFKFIKQYLNAKHFLSRNLNGIKVVFYMILILAIVLLVYKKLNQIDGFKITVMRFKEELRRLITYEIIKYYQVYPDKLDQRDFIC